MIRFHPSTSMDLDATTRSEPRYGTDTTTHPVTLIFLVVATKLMDTC